MVILIVTIFLCCFSVRLFYGPYIFWSKENEKMIASILKQKHWLHSEDSDILMVLGKGAFIRNNMPYAGLFCKWQLLQDVGGNKRIWRWSKLNKQLDEVYDNLIKQY